MVFLWMAAILHHFVVYPVQRYLHLRGSLFGCAEKGFGSPCHEEFSCFGRMREAIICDAGGLRVAEGLGGSGP